MFRGTEIKYIIKSALYSGFNKCVSNVHLKKSNETTHAILNSRRGGSIHSLFSTIYFICLPVSGEI